MSPSDSSSSAKSSQPVRAGDTISLSDGASPGLPPVEPAPCKPGDVLGSYVVQELLGEGGMGFVFAAEHVRLGRKVALKILRTEYATNPRAVARFFGEARAVNKINHEHIVEITDFFEDGKFYIMELLRGQNLRDLSTRGERLSLARCLDIAAQAAEALEAVHAAGIVHRDLKPDNIFLTDRAGKTDYVKLLDFGVAKLNDDTLQSTGHTAAGAILGTAEYMSPEQAGGGVVDFRTDVYALGIILYEMITGMKPFVGATFGDLVIQHLTLPPKPPSEVDGLVAGLPSAFEKLVLRCLEKDVKKRPQTMREVAVELRRIASEEKLDSAPPPPMKTRRRRKRLAVSAVLLVVAAASAWAAREYLQAHPATQRIDSPAAPAEARHAEPPPPPSPAAEPPLEPAPPAAPPVAEKTLKAKALPSTKSKGGAKATPKGVKKKASGTDKSGTLDPFADP